MALKYNSFVDSSLLASSPIMVISPHGDDEILGCGGWLIKSRPFGGSRIVVFVTELCPEREKEMKIALDGLALYKIHCLGLPEFWQKKKVNTDRAIRELADIIAEYKPKVLFTPSPSDLHPDHMGSVKILEEVLRSREEWDYMPMVLHYEIFFPHGKASHWLDITEEVEEKTERIKKYRSQEARYGLSRIMRALNKFRGGVCMKEHIKYVETYAIASPKDLLH